MSEPIDCHDEFSNVRGMNIGKGLQERIKAGKVNDDREKKYEEEWTKKLQCIDEAHTKLAGLNIKDIDSSSEDLVKFTKDANPPACPDHRNKILACLNENQNNSIECGPEIEEFKNCVDEMLLKAVEKDFLNSLVNKKPTYTEKFEQVLA